MGQETRFGGGRHRGTGYLASSRRIGPGVVIFAGPVAPDELFGLADRLNESEGLTVLVAEVGSAEVGAEAVQHLRANWHPRVAVVAFGEAASTALALASDATVDATVVFDGWSHRPSPPATPVLAHFAAHADLDMASIAADIERLLDEGADVQANVYEGAGHLFVIETSATHDAGSAEAAWSQTIDFLRHHLS